MRLKLNDPYYQEYVTRRFREHMRFRGEWAWTISISLWLIGCPLRRVRARSRARVRARFLTRENLDP
jgi:hypothetical protein